MSKKKVIIVLGMHRSGTSALTRGLGALGIHLGDSLYPAADDNPTGFWEDKDVIAINDRLLRELGSSYDRVGLVDARLMGNPAVEVILLDAKATLAAKLEYCSVWGMKDPRTARLLPFWQRLFRELDCELGYVIALRNPLSVADSLSFRNQFAPIKSYWLWLEHTLQAVNDTAGERRLVVSYDGMLNNPVRELNRMAEALQLPSPGNEALKAYVEGFLDNDLRHSARTVQELRKATAELPLLEPVYTLLDECATQVLNLNSDAFEERFQPLMSEMRSFAPTLALVANAEESADIAEHRFENVKEDLAELGRRHNQLRKIVEEGKSGYEMLLDQKRSVDSSFEEFQQAAVLAQSLHESLQDEHNATLLELRNLTHEHQKALGKIAVLSDAWSSFFSSRAWRMLSVMGEKKTLPVVMLSDGQKFDPDYYLQNNSDVEDAQLTPLVHFLTQGLREGRAGAEPMEVAPANQQNGTDSHIQGSEDPVAETHAAPVAVAESVQPFNAEFYLRIYPDIAQAGIDPLHHYLNHGQYEGRLGAVPLVSTDRDLSSLPGDRPTVLVVSHEASRTGAPILSLNIAQQLAMRFNVVALLFGGGALIQAFKDAGVVVAGPIDRSHSVSAQWAISDFLGTHQFEFAVVNSLESHVALKPLAEHYIPAISLIHEFAVYTRPVAAVQNALLWASESVFSAQATLDSAKLAMPELERCRLSILPQGKSNVPGDNVDLQVYQSEVRRIQKALRPEDSDTDTVVILGAGRVQLRKGVELFIECATRVLSSEIGHKCRFVWIGDNYNPDVDITYSVYLQDQIQRAGISDRFSIISETAAIEEVYALSDMLVISSRLDPLPNVAIDAMTVGMPVLCFDRTTGIADVLKRNQLGDACVADYLDTYDLARKVIRLVKDRDTLAEVATKAKAAAAIEFDMGRYVGTLVNIAARHSANLSREQADVTALDDAGIMDSGFWLPPQVDRRDQAAMLRRYVRAWSRGVMRRRGLPGFHPEIYKQMNAQAVGVQDPLAHYVEASFPKGAWTWEHFDWAATEAPAPVNNTLLFVTVTAPELLIEVVKQVIDAGADVEVVVIAGSEAVKRDIEEHLAAELFSPLHVVVGEERPLATLLEHLGSQRYKGYAAIGHVNLDTLPVNDEGATLENYRAYVLENMVSGQYDSIRCIVAAILAAHQDYNLGLVFPEDPYVADLEADIGPLGELCAALRFKRPDSIYAPYPVNGVFWAAPAALARLVNGRPIWSSFFAKNRLNSIERERLLARLLGQSCTSTGKVMSVTVVPGVTY
ncbi:glycosyltransferase [Pseudomonas sp.]|uniref:glycosyltransferase n=1 Tax=Pseudomonas sp. TaxID=306 RepID=UPI00259093AC|nr:glycosyltransferase [Pseudomonas sp.]